MGKLKVLLCSAILAGLVAAAAGQGDGQNVKIEQVWTGRFLGKEKEVLRTSAPAKLYVSGPKGFAAIWKQWRTEEKIPEIDFSKKLVLVSTVGGPNEVKLTPSVDAAGNLTVKSQATLVGGPGFGYALGVVDRDGVKTVQGKPLVKDD